MIKINWNKCEIKSNFTTKEVMPKKNTRLGEEGNDKRKRKITTRACT